ncbi:hypothetical protein [Adhaeribacter terreus]|uniref:Uncharacterized protein n=1 Tax=Adhaeribacter terreus TaxID=529703 RepID=A0ABW0EAB7_9BACT
MLKRLLFLLPSLFVGFTGFSQEAGYDDILFNGRFSLNQNSDKHAGMLYRQRGLEDNQSIFYYSRMDSSLATTSSVLKLHRRNVALASTGNGHYSAHLFQRVGYDSVRTIILGKEGEIISKKSSYRGYGKPKLITLSKADNDSTFLLVYATKSPKGYVIQKIDLGQNVLWEQKISPEKGAQFLQLLVNNAHIWAIAATKPGTGKVIQTIYCLAGTTGNIIGQSKLNQPTDRREIGAIGFGPDQEIAINGRWFNKMRTSPNKPGQMFFTRISPTGQRLADATGTNAGSMLALQKQKVLWEKLQYTPDGSWHLVGESFKSTSYMAHLLPRIALGIVTFGYVNMGFSTVRTQDLLHLTLSPEGKLETFNNYRLPVTSYTFPNWIPPYRLATLAFGQGIFRYRGHFSNPFSVIIKTPEEVKIVNTQNHQISTLTSLDKNTNEDVFGVLGNKLLIFRGTRKEVGMWHVELPSEILPAKAEIPTEK